MNGSEGIAVRARPAAAWPPDDTEESVVGTDFHQMTITNLRVGINEAAHTLMAPGQSAPWQALSQTTVSGFSHPDGSRYSMLPDVFVYRRAIDQTRSSLAIGVDGPPILAIEVLSDTTYEWDLDLKDGKGYSYAAAGVVEYLTIDPIGRYLPERVRAWRLTAGVYLPWEADEPGRWQSGTLQLTLALEGAYAAVYANDGRRMLREGQIEDERARARLALEQAEADRQRAETELARQAERLARQEEELERLRRLLNERGEQA